MATILWEGCNRPSSTHSVDSTLTVEKLLANPQEHSHAVISVRGCVVRGFEILVLQPCGGQSRTESIWLEDAGNEQAMTKLRRIHPEYRLPPGPTLFFQFDETRNSIAWKKLDAAFKDNFVADVVLVGQFETGSGFGHMGGYMHELILVDVLNNKYTATP